MRDAQNVALAIIEDSIDKKSRIRTGEAQRNSFAALKCV
jgi:hypothetical protein